MKRQGAKEYGGQASHAAPKRTPAQHLDALERANQVRIQRAELKRDLKGRRISIHALLLDPPEFVETAKVFDMLLAVPKYGRVKVNRVLTQCRISPSTTIGGLSERQRDELVKLLPPDPADPSITAAEEQLTRDVTALLEEARQVGRRAGHAAHDAGEELDATAPKPDASWLAAALARTVRRGLPAFAPQSRVPGHADDADETRRLATLHSGSRGPAVETVQRLLKLLFYQPGPVDGNFGPETESAVKWFQHDHDLEPDGIVGPTTWARLTRPTLTKGSKDATVIEAQTLLELLGYPPGEIDGIFGSQTEQAVRALQADFGLRVDGVVGPRTWAMLQR